MSSIGGPSGPPGGVRAPLPVGGDATRPGESGGPSRPDTGVGALGRALQGVSAEGVAEVRAGRFSDFTITVGTTRSPGEAPMREAVGRFTAALPGDLGGLARAIGESRGDRQAVLALERGIDAGALRLDPGDPAGSLQSLRDFAETLPPDLAKAVLSLGAGRLGSGAG